MEKNRLLVFRSDLVQLKQILTENPCVEKVEWSFSKLFLLVTFTNKNKITNALAQS